MRRGGIGGRTEWKQSETGTAVYLSRHYSDAVLPSDMTAKGLLKLLRSHGCVELRQRGSHIVVQCGTCVSVVPAHAGEDLGRGLLRKIERDLEPCLGKSWLRRGVA